jgi:dienelactone hydrolase
MNTPVLDLEPPADEVRAIALVLHGGRANGMGAVRRTQLAVVRMAPFATSLHRAGRKRGLAVARLRYTVRGWNKGEQSPVRDVEWALDRLAEDFPDVPVALVGHSMGGRAALYAAGRESVQAVVGLAPWLEAGDPCTQLAGRRILLVHGDRDRMTSARRSASYAEDARTVAASVNYVSIQRERHAMLRRAKLWHALTTGYVLDVMCAVPPGETVDGATANVLAKVLAGQASLVV